jgi:hypothetical protein
MSRLMFAAGLIGVALVVGILTVMGDGGFKRMVTITGIYSICKPDGYEVVCFLDADGKEGGMFCLPLAQVGGECKR